MVDETRVEVVRRARRATSAPPRARHEQPVRGGQLLAEVYSPDLLTARRIPPRPQVRDDPAWLAAARQKLSLLGLSGSR